eukprot:2338474-Prymnesium_polylepis.2
MHARICLEFDDETELKQCQSQLSQLYEEGLGSFDGQCEFTAYNLLYNVGQVGRARTRVVARGPFWPPRACV